MNRMPSATGYALTYCCNQVSHLTCSLRTFVLLCMSPLPTFFWLEASIFQTWPKNLRSYHDCLLSSRFWFFALWIYCPLSISYLQQKVWYPIGTFLLRRKSTRKIKTINIIPIKKLKSVFRIRAAARMN